MAKCRRVAWSSSRLEGGLSVARATAVPVSAGSVLLGVSGGTGFVGARGRRGAGGVVRQPHTPRDGADRRRGHRAGGEAREPGQDRADRVGSGFDALNNLGTRRFVAAPRESAGRAPRTIHLPARAMRPPLVRSSGWCSECGSGRCRRSTARSACARPRRTTGRRAPEQAGSGNFAGSVRRLHGEGLRPAHAVGSAAADSLRAASPLRHGGPAALRHDRAGAPRCRWLGSRVRPFHFRFADARRAAPDQAASAGEVCSGASGARDCRSRRAR